MNSYGGGHFSQVLVSRVYEEPGSRRQHMPTTEIICRPGYAEGHGVVLISGEADLWRRALFAGRYLRPRWEFQGSDAPTPWIEKGELSSDELSC